MRYQDYALAVIVSAVFASCGNNSSDKETIAPVSIPDTAIAVQRDTIQAADTLQTKPAVTVPSKTKTNFDKKYPKATEVKWERSKQEKGGVEWDLTEWPEKEEEDRSAWFHWQGDDHQAYYDRKGDWVGTVNTVKDPATLPAAVTSSINSNFSGYKVTSVSKENDRKRTAYEITLVKGDEKVKALIDDSGNLVKRKTMK